VFYAVHVVSKESRRSVLPRTSCLIFILSQKSSERGWRLASRPHKHPYLGSNLSRLEQAKTFMFVSYRSMSFELFTGVKTHILIFNVIRRYEGIYYLHLQNISEDRDSIFFRELVTTYQTKQSHNPEYNNTSQGLTCFVLSSFILPVIRKVHRSRWDNKNELWFWKVVEGRSLAENFIHGFPRMKPTLPWCTV
jgi:hypothetical protein